MTGGLLSGCPERADRNGVDPTVHVTDWQDEPVRGLADPVTVERNVSRDSDCVTPAMNALGSRLDEGVDDLTAVNHGWSNGQDGIGVEHLSVTRHLHVEDGDVTLKPNVSLATLRGITPRTIRTTTRTETTERPCQYPVYVYDQIVRLQ
jgi:hypothetical protein